MDGHWPPLAPESQKKWLEWWVEDKAEGTLHAGAWEGARGAPGKKWLGLKSNPV